MPRLNQALSSFGLLLIRVVQPAIATSPLFLSQSSCAEGELDACGLSPPLFSDGTTNVTPPSWNSSRTTVSGSLYSLGPENFTTRAPGCFESALRSEKSSSLTLNSFSFPQDQTCLLKALVSP